MTYDEIKELSDEDLRTEIVAHGLFDLDDFRDPIQDISAAWQVAENFHEKTNAEIDLLVRKLFYLKGTPKMYLCCIRGGKIAYDNPNLSVGVNADTAPRAICRAVLFVTMDNKSW